MPFTKGNKLGRGRPRKGQDASAQILAALKRAQPGTKDLLADKIADGVKAGDYNFCKLAADYAYGKPVDKAEVSMTVDVPRAIEFKSV